MPVPPELAPRRYADLLHQNHRKWGVWDPSNAPKIGSYGHINIDTGVMDVEGNVYDPVFQTYVDECDGIKIVDYPPLFSKEEVDPLVYTMWTRHKDWAALENAPTGVNTAPTKGQFWFQKGRSAALLLMYDPKEQILPDPVLHELFKIPLLKHKHLVTRVMHCSAYARYLTSTDGDSITLALKGSIDLTPKPPPPHPRPRTNPNPNPFDILSPPSPTFPLPSDEPPEEPRYEGPLEWYTAGCEPGYLDAHVDPKGEARLRPLFSLKQKYPLIRALMRDEPEPDPEPEDFWCQTFPPWLPLNEDGEVDPTAE